MINIKNVVIQPSSMLVLVPEKESKLQLLNVQVKADAVFKIIKMGRFASDAIDLEVGDGVILYGTDQGGLLQFENEKGKERHYLIIDTSQIKFGVKNVKEDSVKITEKQTTFEDHNIVSEALDHAKFIKA